MKQLIEPFNSRKMYRATLPLSERHPLHVAHSRMSRQSTPAFNMHYALELGLVLSGRFRRYYRNWSVDLTAGQVWLCGIWEPHGYLALEPSPRILVFSSLPEMPAMTGFQQPPFDWIAPFTVPPQKRPWVGTKDRRIFLALGRRVVDVLERNQKQRDILLRLLFLEIIVELCAGWSFPAKDRKAPPDCYLTVNKAIQTVFNSRRLVTVREVSKACGLSESAFAGLFFKVMGIGFPDFSLRYRLNGAKEELARSLQPIKMIAASWGFTDKSHFHHVFFKHYCCTPAEFRKKYAAIPRP